MFDRPERLLERVSTRPPVPRQLGLWRNKKEELDGSCLLFLGFVLP